MNCPFIKWEKISDNLLRTKVPGGWLVNENNPTSDSSFNSNICYIPDPNHEWLNQKSEWSCLDNMY